MADFLCRIVVGKVLVVLLAYDIVALSDWLVIGVSNSESI